jgi:cytosine deaminase
LPAKLQNQSASWESWVRGFDAIRRLKSDYAWAIDLEICVFPQEGLLNDPGAEDLLVAAYTAGADLFLA